MRVKPHQSKVVILKTNAFTGFLEELDTRRIIHSRIFSRSILGNLDELMISIEEKGLLQPIVVRPLGHLFEVIAGNRRLEACKRLGMNRIFCHIVEMDDREAYEVSLIENLQRRTLDPVEEAQAFKRYVDDYGYGSISELARNIARSEQYVSARIGLLKLPREVLEQVTRRVVTPSHVRELLGLDGEQQRAITQLIVEEHVPSKEVRKIVRQVKQRNYDNKENEPFFLAPYPESSDLRRRHVISRTYARCIASLRISIMRFDDALEYMGDYEWIDREVILEQRRYLHEQIDDLLRLKRKMQREAWYAHSA